MKKISKLAKYLAVPLLAGAMAVTSGCATYNINSDIPAVENHQIRKGDMKGLVSYVQSEDSAVTNLLKDANLQNKDSYEKAREIYNLMAKKGIIYERSSNDRLGDSEENPNWTGLQYPKETLATKKGDCKNLCFLYASFLKNQGIEGKIVNIPGHVFIIFKAGDSEKIPERNYLNPLSASYVPVDISYIDQMNFEGAVDKGVDNLRLNRGSKRMVDY